MAWASPGSWREMQQPRPHPRPSESESAFSQDPGGSTVLNSLSLIFPYMKTGMAKLSWQIHSHLNKIISVERFCFKKFALPLPPSRCLFVCKLLLLVTQNYSTRRGTYFHILPMYGGSHRGPSGVDDLGLPCPTLGAPGGQGLALFHLCSSGS